METIFLTSQASEVMDEIVTMLPKKPEEYSVLFIPTASRPYSPVPWIEKDRDKLFDLGFRVKDIQLDEVTKEEVKEAVETADIIFVGGGNTFYLLEHAKKSGFIEITKAAVAEGKIYIGSSAGSALAAPDVRYVELFDDPSEANLTDTRALDLVPFRVLPHFGLHGYEELHTKVLLEYQSEDSVLIPIKDSEFVLLSGEVLKAN